MARLGTLVYAASNIELEQILITGSACSRIVFMHSGHQPVVRSGSAEEEKPEVLRSYFGKKTILNEKKAAGMVIMMM